MKPFGGTVTSTNKTQSESWEVRLFVTERMKRQTSNKYKLFCQDLSDPLQTINGLTHGCSLSCLLFNLALEKVTRDPGIQTKGRHIIL
jgi:hypothetical protein